MSKVATYLTTYFALRYQVAYRTQDSIVPNYPSLTPAASVTTLTPENGHVIRKVPTGKSEVEEGLEAALSAHSQEFPTSPQGHGSNAVSP